ncbi:MAG: poly(3-hydroxybutyrate) depolymerase [Rhodomicrobiaceae bacterium]
MLRFLRLAVMVVLFAAAGARAGSAQPLPALAADLDRTTVSGLSSGAYMAGQFQVAHSQTVIGAGLVAGGPYACAHTPGGEINPFWAVVIPWNLHRAQNSCMEDGWLFSSVPDAGELLDHARKLARQGKIDPLDGLADDRVYLFTSSADSTVESGVVEEAKAFYLAAGIADANIRYETHDSAAHAFLTEDQGLACGQSGAPFLNDCDFDQAKAVLEWLYGSLKPAGETPAGSFLRFEQGLYSSDPGNADLGSEGMAYIPQGCRSQPGCAVHIVFHGCKQGLAAIGDSFVTGSGYARWAENNRIVLLFPQAVSSTLNPNGCWDWWGYTGRDFLTRDAPQIRAVRQMLDRLAQRP